MNAGFLDYFIDRKVFFKLLLNCDEIFMIDILDIVDDGPFMLLVEDEQFLSVKS